MCIDVLLRERGTAEVMIENFMLLANECAAKLAQSQDVPFVYRVHETPDPEKVLELAKLVELFGLKLSKAATSKPKPSHFTTVLKAAKKLECSDLITNRVLRTMSKARYSEKPLGHFGLALGDYCHFTSPIRRYPDIVVHWVLSDIVASCETTLINQKYENFVAEAAEESSFCEVRAVNAERETEKFYMAEFMAQHVGDQFKGKISGVVKKGFFVELENTVEGFVTIESLGDENFVSDGVASVRNIKTNKKYSIGDFVDVTVVYVNISSGIVDFAVKK